MANGDLLSYIRNKDNVSENSVLFDW
jgi:hypothetical protein